MFADVWFYSVSNAIVEIIIYTRGGTIYGAFVVGLRYPTYGNQI